MLIRCECFTSPQHIPSPRVSTNPSFTNEDLQSLMAGSRDISDITDLTEEELDELHRLYPRIADNEGWFGKDVALYCMEHHKKAI